MTGQLQVIAQYIDSTDIGSRWGKMVEKMIGQVVVNFVDPTSPKLPTDRAACSTDWRLNHRSHSFDKITCEFISMILLVIS
jgi:hypothetical protein